MRFVKTRNGSGPTRFLHVFGAGSSLGSSADSIGDVFREFGPVEVLLIESKRFCFVVYEGVLSAEQALIGLQDRVVPQLGSSLPIKISYADLEISQEDCITSPTFDGSLKVELKGDATCMGGLTLNGLEIQSLKNTGDLTGTGLKLSYINPEPTCISVTAHVDVPGCHIFEEFISGEEESRLLSSIEEDTTALWECELTRRVKHYGFPFNYRTLMLDYGKPTPPLPSECQALALRMLSLNTSFLSDSNGSLIKEDNRYQTSTALTQLTVNEYLPGQGIAQHTDTESCFGSDIYVLNLGCGIVMTLQEQKKKAQEFGVESFDDSDNEDDNDDDNEKGSREGLSSKQSTRPPVRKYLWLPARSLLVLSGPARYCWSHGIAPRTTDKVNGCLINRGKRVSLTFRQALIPGSLPSSSLASSELEKDHVFRVYDNIAVHWNHTRGKRKVHWPRIKSFIDDLPKGSLLADIGSGDGKYFGVNPAIFSIGCDRSLKLLQVSHQMEFEAFCCDAVKLPLRSNAFDATICIAVLHHLATVDRRSAVIRELLRITAHGGFVMIHAWAKEQGQDSKHNFPDSDMMVPWRLQKRFFQPGHSTSNTDILTSTEDSIDGEGVVKSVNKKSKKVRKPKKGKVNCPPLSVWRDVGDDDEREVANSAQHIIEGKAGIEGEEKGEGEEDSDIPTAAVEEIEHQQVEVEEEISPEGRCEHVVEEGDQLLFQRYCHVYQQGELEDLCSCIPNCRIVETGWDKGNWTVMLEKIEDMRLSSDLALVGPDGPTPVLRVRK